MSGKSYGLRVAALTLSSILVFGIGAHATISKMRNSHRRSVAGRPLDHSVIRSSRLALVIGNSHYPDAEASLAHPINDARLLNELLKRAGFDTIVVEDARGKDLNDAVTRARTMVKPGAVVALFFGGFGIQIGGENFMIPVDASIWREADVLRDGVSIEALLSQLRATGAGPELVIIDASRRNPFERRFRDYSHGLGPINAPVNALTIVSTSPDQVADDVSGQNSLLISSLLAVLKSPNAGAVEVFYGILLEAHRRSGGTQIPSVSSSLVDDIHLD